MIDREKLKEFISSQLEGTSLFMVDLSVSKDNDIQVVIDSDEPLSIEECEKLTRAIESEFDRDLEDYTLEVGSAGLTSPLKVPRQYKKYIGRDVEVVLSDGKKLIGMLKEAGDDSFTIVYEEKVKKEGQKRPTKEEVEKKLSYNEVKQTKYLLKF